MKFLHGCIHVHVYALHLPEYPVNHKSCTQNAKEHQKTKTIYYKQNLFSKKNCFHKYLPLSHVFTF